MTGLLCRRERYQLQEQHNWCVALFGSLQVFSLYWYKLSTPHDHFHHRGRTRLQCREWRPRPWSLRSGYPHVKSWSLTDNAAGWYIPASGFLGTDIMTMTAPTAMAEQIKSHLSGRWESNTQPHNKESPMKNPPYAAYVRPKGWLWNVGIIPYRTSARDPKMKKIQCHPSFRNFHTNHPPPISQIPAPTKRPMLDITRIQLLCILKGLYMYKRMKGDQKLTRLLSTSSPRLLLLFGNSEAESYKICWE